MYFMFFNPMKFNVHYPDIFLSKSNNQNFCFIIFYFRSFSSSCRFLEKNMVHNENAETISVWCLISIDFFSSFQFLKISQEGSFQNCRRLPPVTAIFTKSHWKETILTLLQEYSPFEDCQGPKVI